MTSEMFFLIAVSAILVAAAGWDLASYTIPNFLPLALLGAFVVFIVVTRMHAPAIGIHALAGLAGLTLGFTLFAFGLIGGGDAKLFAMIVLWLGFGKDPSNGLLYLFEYVMMTAVFGGALAIVLIGLRNVPMPTALSDHPWLARLHDARSGIPYGVALAAGALVILLDSPHAEIFRIATG
jgi:prepilin peptidase CpaA